MTGYIEFSEDENTPLNTMIKEAWDMAESLHKNDIKKEFIEKLREIYKTGFHDGETNVWKVRRGDVTTVYTDKYKDLVSKNIAK
jgi:hypothetical protein